MTNRFHSKFSITKAFSFALKSISENLAPFLALGLFSLIFRYVTLLMPLYLYDIPFAYLPATYGQVTNYIPWPTRVAFQIGGVLISFYVMHQVISLGMARHKGAPISLGSAFNLSLRSFFPFLGAQLLLMIKMIIGFILLIIPGFYLWTKNYFAGYPVIDSPHTTIGEDTEVVHQLTRNVQWRLFGLIMIIFSLPIIIFLATCFGFNTLGFAFLPLLLSIDAATIIIMSTLMPLINTHIYLQLKEARLEKVEPSQ